MHLALLLAPALVILCLLVFTIPVLLRLLRPCETSDLTPDWLEEFQPSSYEVMEKLLAPDDFDFVLGEPGYDPSIRRNLRRARLKVFRGYLNRLISDFNRLHRFAVLMVARTDMDRSALMVRLLKLRLQFSLSVLKVEFSYALCRLGLQSMSLGDLLTQFNAMSEQLVSAPNANMLSANL